MRSLLLTVAFVSAASLSSAQSPVIHAKLVPASNIIVGQPVHLVVEVLVPNFFTGEPLFPTFELENAIVVLPEESTENFNEQVNGQSLSGIRRTYFLYPQQAGDFRLPAIQIVVPYAIAPPKGTEAHLTIPSLAFHADIPVAARGLSYFLPTARLTMQQRWSTPLNKLRVGDVAERTITVTVDKMQGMLIPPLPFEAPSGIKAYPEEPKVQNQMTDRGEFVQGLRVQSAKYFIQKEGDYTLPAIELKWWNLNTNRLVTATIPTVHFTAASNPGYVAELPPELEIATIVPPKPASLWSRYRWTLKIAPWALATLILMWLAYRYLPRLVQSLKIRQTQHAQSESVHFRSLLRACRRNDAHTAYARLLLWLGHAERRSTLDIFLYQCGDEDLTQQLNALTETLFASSSNKTWNGRIMADRLRKHRHAQALKLRQKTPLPLLNP